MKKTNMIRNLILGGFGLLVFSMTGFAQATLYSAAGANPAAIQATVDQFRTDLGALNPNNGQSFTSGRREINWDGVPDALSSPNSFPPNFFNTNSPRGVVFGNVGSNNFQVSATTASGTPVRFGNIDASYTATFQAFSAQRLFSGSAPVLPSSFNLHRVVEVDFFIPGTNIPATVNAFGAVFCDVDAASGTFIEFYRANGTRIEARAATVFNNGLSFLGVIFVGERVARVRIVSGNSNIGAGNPDGGAANDVVVMDDFIYGEPRATEHHSSDFDGDGTADLAVFRPSIGTWFILNSGSNTFNGIQFGANGDVPIDGDFDGDSRNDIAVFRPSSGTWFVRNSSNGAFSGVQFGTNGDKPVAGDYDKDGKTDVAVWRPSSGFYFRLNSSNGQFNAQQFGQNGDIPIASALIP